MQRSLRKTDWGIGLALVLAFLASGGSTPFLALEQSVYDFVLSYSTAEARGAEVAVIEVDEASLAELGPWPWPREHLAQVLERLHGASAIGLALPLDQPQRSHELRKLDGLTATHAGSPDDGVATLLVRLRKELDSDTSLANRLNANVLLGVSSESPARSLSVVDTLTQSHHPAAAWLARFPSPLSSTLAVSSLAVPLAPFLTASGGAAPLVLESARTASGVPLALVDGGRLVPAFALELARRASGEPASLGEPRGLRFGERNLATDWAYRVYPRFPGLRAAVQTYSFHEVLSGETSPSVFAGKPVLIGLSGSAATPLLSLAGGGEVSPLIGEALVVSALLGDGLMELPEWTLPAYLLAFVLVALFLGGLLPRLSLSTGAVVTLLLVLVLLNVEFVLLAVRNMWLPMATPALALVAGAALFMTRRMLARPAERLRLELSDTNRHLGQTLQAQGQLDPAFERYRRCTMDLALAEQLYSLGLDYERKRQFNKAAGLFEYLNRQSPGFRDADERLRCNREVENRLVLGRTGPSAPTGTLIMEPGGTQVQRPMLGRYEVESEIGRGAMGLVYLGRDPKIGRKVAIKTMALGQEFEDDQLAGVKERFFREAETAGRLNHPHIVTVYDVGDDQDLAYIAMDYVKGVNLGTYARPERLLPMSEVIELMARVAEALDYAHSQNVVHRDIKPANIIYDRDTGQLKVTDFGVACLTDSSKTRTGTILGSPSYMSPEQLAGGRVDGRSDLFSLGVTLFQLLTGELPFNGDSFAALMFRIANDKHPDVRSLRPDVPDSARRIINKTLQKAPDRRYQSGSSLATALRRCGADA